MNERAPREDQSDEYQLVCVILAGDHNRFEELVYRYQDMIFGMIKRQIRDEGIARDLSQETFLRAFKGLKGFRNYSTFSTWLTRIALNVTNSYFSSRRYRENLKNVALDMSHLKGTVPPEPVAETDTRAASIHLLQRCIGELKPKYREVVVLCSLEGKTYVQAAEILQIPVGTVCSRMNTALTKLRHQFTRHSMEGKL